MNSKLIKQLLLYSSPILVYVVFSYAQPLIQTGQPEAPSVNIIQYPQSGPQARGDSGYIAAYYALQKLGVNVAQDRQSFFLTSKNAIKKKRLLEATEARIRSDLQDFIEKKPTPTVSPVPGISPQDFKEIILSVIPDIAKVAAAEFMRVNFDDKSGTLGDRKLEISGAQLFKDIAQFLSMNESRYKTNYKITWSMLAPDVTKDNYQALKDFTGLRDVSELEVLKKEVLETLHTKYPHQEGTQADAEASGAWLSAQELASLIIANTKDVEKVMILSDLGLLKQQAPESAYAKAPEDKGADRTREIIQIFDNIKRKMAQVDQGTQTFIIDKNYVRGRPDQPHIWVPVIINKQGGQLRLALIDPENLITQDNENLQILLKHLT
ncbi:MAG: hypothetical protein AB7F19_00900 [Candidatus Babeliales bacterium]